MTGRRRVALIAALALAAGVALALGALVPKRIPDPALPNRVLARPHRIVIGQDIDATRLLQRIERLGYRRTRSSAPEPGEYFRSDDRVAIHRRVFVGPTDTVAAMRLEIRLARGNRVAQIRDDAGRELRDAWLDPETLGALADDAPSSAC